MNITLDVVAFIQEQFKGADHIPLHEPAFDDRELELVRSIRSTFVSSVGEFVDEFERALASYVGAPCVVVTSSGTFSAARIASCAGRIDGDVVGIPTLNVCRHLQRYQAGWRPTSVR